MPIATILDEEPKIDAKPLIESSTYRSYKAYVEAGFEANVPRITFGAQYEREKDFLSAVDMKQTETLLNTKQGLPKRVIKKMIRQKIKGEEFLTFTEDWQAKDWIGRDIEGVTDKMEGIVYLPNVTPRIDEKGQKVGKDLNGRIPKYEIPFNKENVDKWIEETGTPKDQITYTVRGPSGLRGEGTYDQFLYPWNQALDAMMKDGGFAADYLESLKKKSAKA